MDAMTAARLNRAGYRFRIRSADPVRAMIEAAGGRLIPINRHRPAGTGWERTTCPSCGAETFWAEPDGTWSRTCRCRPSTGDAFALLAVLLARDVA